jgi:multidrug transporter EmrE-like cation transporter
MSYQDLIPLVITEIVGDFGFKTFANNGGIIPLATGTIGYIGVIYYLVRSLQGSSILIVNNVWDGLSSLIESTAAFFILGERLEHIHQYIGISLIVIGLMTLRIPTLRKTEFIFPKIFPFTTHSK